MGFRPFVWSLADEMGLRGWVVNDLRQCGRTEKLLAHQGGCKRAAEGGWRGWVVNDLLSGGRKER